LKGFARYKVFLDFSLNFPSMEILFPAGFRGFYVAPEAEGIPAIAPCMTENSSMRDIKRIKDAQKCDLWTSIVIATGMPPSLRLGLKSLPSSPAIPLALPAKETGKFDDGGLLYRVGAFRRGSEIGTGCADMIEVRGRSNL
jgi:hypothetical protein